MCFIEILSTFLTHVTWKVCILAQLVNLDTKMLPILLYSHLYKSIHFCISFSSLLNIFIKSLFYKNLYVNTIHIFITFTFIKIYFLYPNTQVCLLVFTQIILGKLLLILLTPNFPSLHLWTNSF